MKSLRNNFFLSQAREHKFVVRDFVYNPDELAAGKNELTKLATDKKKQFGPLVGAILNNESQILIIMVNRNHLYNYMFIYIYNFTFDGLKSILVNVYGMD